MKEDIKYPVPRLLPKRARKLRKLRSMWPHLARKAGDADAMAKFLAPVLAGEMRSYSEQQVGEKPDTDNLSAEMHAKILGFNQVRYRIALNLVRGETANRRDTLFEALGKSATNLDSFGRVRKVFDARRVTTMLLERLNDGWHTAGFNDDFTGAAAENSEALDASSRNIRIRFRHVTSKKVEPGDYVYSADKKTYYSYAVRPDLWEMYRALKVPEGFSKPFCSLPGPDQHRLLIGVVNVFSTPLPKGAIVVQCEFIDRRTKGTKDRGVRQGYMVFHPEVPFYGFGWTARKAISDMKKSMAKRLTEVVRQSSS